LEPPGAGSTELISWMQFSTKPATPRARDSWFAMTEFIAGTANWEQSAFATEVAIAPSPDGKRLFAMELKALAALGFAEPVVVRGVVPGVLVFGVVGGAVVLVSGDGGTTVEVGGGCVVNVVSDDGGMGGGGGIDVVWGGVLVAQIMLVPVATHGVPEGQHQLVLISQIV
jgi:hypothetical protein